jgi:hypothetical protein
MNPKILFGVALVGVAAAVVFAGLAQKPAAKPRTADETKTAQGYDPNVNPDLKRVEVAIATGYAGVDLKTKVITLEHLQDNNGEFAFSGGYLA